VDSGQKKKDYFILSLGSGLEDYLLEAFDSEVVYLPLKPSLQCF